MHTGYRSTARRRRRANHGCRRAQLPDQKDTTMNRLVIVAALLATLATTAAALAAGAPAITEKVLGAASISQHYTIHVRKPADVIVAKATVPPGASFGWHSH